MARRRMYLFEHAYSDFYKKLKKMGKNIVHICKIIWDLFFLKQVKFFIEILIIIIIVLVGIVVGVFYVLDQQNDVVFSISTIIAFVIIVALITLVLVGWKDILKMITIFFSACLAVSAIILFFSVIVGFFTAIFLVYFIFLLLLTILSLLFFLPIRLYVTINSLLHKITYQCPYDDCSYRGLPVHVCSCGTGYSNLIPNFYGIFYHTCYHEKESVKLPTLNILGRNKLPRLCGKCRRPITVSSLGELAEFPIAIMGGMHSGKTMYFTRLIYQAVEYFNTLPEASVNIDSHEYKELFKKELFMQNNVNSSNTIGIPSHAFPLAIKIKKPALFRKLLYIYDAVGEEMASNMDKLTQKQRTHFLSGIILLIDPISIAELNKIRKDSREKKTNSFIAFGDFISRFINFVQHSHLSKPGDRSPIRIAIVINKADLFPVYNYQFLTDLYTDKDEIGTVEYSNKCRNALITLGEGNSVRVLEEIFINVRYFVCSAKGYTYNKIKSQMLKPFGILQPLLWLINHEDNNFRFMK